MNLREFIQELVLYYGLTGTNESKQLKIETYVEVIGARIAAKYANYDYKKLLRYLQIKYSAFPALDKVLEAIPAGKYYNPASYSGFEGRIIKKEINGHIYEFTIVPNSWENVKTISQLNEKLNIVKL